MNWLRIVSTSEKSFAVLNVGLQIFFWKRFYNSAQIDVQQK